MSKLEKIYTVGNTIFNILISINIYELMTMRVIEAKKNQKIKNLFNQSIMYERFKK